MIRRLAVTALMGASLLAVAPTDPTPAPTTCWCTLWQVMTNTCPCAQPAVQNG
ncbi:hypothetical protein SAMN05660976_04646 [Nonomuraea pusilla]|uniref:Uncharacterized protein n=1 Tax=Nonomuraea pusilla TaxID=46177 RepID=A0A1H7WXF2_9ACTN|nr:hypothetical protein SAMN05660976_04646 [Nonomuraea pusilla]